MSAYLIVVGLTGLLTALSRTCARRPSTWTYFDLLAVSVLIAFSALRFQVGTDYALYYRLYNSLEPTTWWHQIMHSPQEAGYTALSLGLRSVSSSPYLIFWAASTLTVIPVYAAIKRRSVNPTLSVLLYILLAFYVAPFNILRQGIAMSLNFYADRYIDEDKRKWAAINALAGTFHTTAWIAALIQLAVRRHQPRLRLLLAVVVAGVAVLALLPHGGELSTALNTLNPRYETYIGTKAGGLGSYLNLAVLMVLLLFVVILKSGDRQNQRYMTYAVMGLFFLIVGLNSVVLARMELYFGVFLVLLIPNRIAERRCYVAKSGVLALATVYFALYIQHFSTLVPYHSYVSLGW